MKIRPNRFSLKVDVKSKLLKKLNIKYQNIEIKQIYKKLRFALGCAMNEKTLRRTYGFKSYINKINGKLKFLYRKNSFLTLGLRRILYYALIQSHFDYVCSAWYPNLNVKLKKSASNAK